MSFEKLSMYRLVEKVNLNDIDSTGYFFEHKSTKARVCIISNDDENKVFTIGFRTPPEDSTGLPHILEHSVLCGSKNFPVKDPFVELAKGSLNTFLNAMTYPDKTVYPVASCNDKDYENLMHVYLDAVFYPNIYTEDKILKQEAWHYELEDKDGELSINGVVYNEMKGVYSLPEGILERESLKKLYPDTCYANDSGGMPEHIPELTQEKFTEFHSKYYHPSNSYIYMYGNMDFEERLLWMDKEYLSKFEERKIDSEIATQEAFSEAREDIIKYSISPEEKEIDNTYLCYYQSVGNANDYELITAFQVLEYVLIMAPGAPIKKALMDAKIGKDVLGGFEKDLKQPIFSIVAKNTNSEKKQEFLNIIDGVLRAQVKNGIDKKALRAALSTLEFSYREADYDRYPKGLMYGLNLIGAWLYSDKVPFEALELLRVYELLNAKIDSGYFEELIEKYLVNNNHKAILVMEPEKDLNAKTDDELRKRLASYKDALSEKELESLISENNALKLYQQEPSSREDMQKLPMLKREDMRRKVWSLNNRLMDLDGTAVLVHDYNTNGIAYLDILFDIKDMKPERLPYVALLKNVLMFVDTDEHEYGDLFNEIQCYSGSMSFNTSTYEKSGTDKDYGSNFVFTSKAVYRNYPKVFSLLKEILESSHLDDYKRLYEIIAEQKSQLQMGILSSGHLYSMMRASANYAKSCYVDDMFSGIGYYDFIKDCEENFDEKKDIIVKNLKELVSMIFSEERMFISFTGEEEGLNILRDELSGFRQSLKKICKMPFETGDIILNRKNEGIRCASKVQYVALTGDFSSIGDKHHGTLNVVATMMRFDYLWNQIRVLGGAYGCMNGYGRSGKSYFISYRDPHLKRTLDVYKNAADYLRAFDGDEDEITKYIIGTLSDLDLPLPPRKKGSRSLLAYLSGITEEMLQDERNEVLNITKEDINSMGDYIEKIVSDNHLCVIGNEEKINENAELFDIIRTI